MNSIVLTGNIVAFASANDVLNPYLKSIKFVLADDKPNLNNQGIPYDEFDNLAKSAIGMPIKIRFVGKRAGGAANHEGSIPIGHIVSVSEEEDGGNHKLIASGALYADEYPDVIEYLEESFAANDAPGISWELSYHDSVLERGIQWLKGVITRAATFVRNPAYGKRTALLAIAQDMTLSDDALEQILGILMDDKEDPIKDTPEGGTDTVNLEEALNRIKELETQLQSTIDDNKVLSESASRVSELEQTVAELTGIVGEYQKATIVAERTARVVEAGLDLETDTDALASKQEIWVAMSEDVFNAYIDAIATMAKKSLAKSEASAKKPSLAFPKISVDTSKIAGTSTPDLKDKMRSLSRTSATVAETD